MKVAPFLANNYPGTVLYLSTLSTTLLLFLFNMGNEFTLESQSQCEWRRVKTCCLIFATLHIVLVGVEGERQAWEAEASWKTCASSGRDSTLTAPLTGCVVLGKLPTFLKSSFLEKARHGSRGS